MAYRSWSYTYEPRPLFSFIDICRETSTPDDKNVITVTVDKITRNKSPTYYNIITFNLFYECNTIFECYYTVIIIIIANCK